MKVYSDFTMGKYLAFRRKNRGLSQQYIAMRLEIKREVIRDREMGINLRLDFIQEISIRIYNESLTDFLVNYFKFQEKILKEGE